MIPVLTRRTLPPRLLLGHLFMASFLCLSAQSGPVELADLSRIVRLSSPQLSPEGRLAALIVGRQDYDNNRFEQELLVIDLSKKTQRSLVTQRRSLGQPRWSPDGTLLAFLAAGEQGRQVHLLPMSGGEAKALTAAPGGVRSFAWSPDGRRIAYIADDKASVGTGSDRFNDAFEVGSNDYLQEAAPPANYIGIIGADGREAFRLTPDSVRVATGLATSTLSWSFDGQIIAFIRYPSSFSGDSDLGKAYLIEVANGRLRALTNNDRLESGAYFAPDGKGVAYSYPRDGAPANLDEVYWAPAGTGPARSLTRQLDRQVNGFQWQADGSFLVSAPYGLRIGLWSFDPDGRSHRHDLGPVVSLGDWHAGPGGAVLFIGSEPYRPEELYYKASLTDVPLRLTDFNAGVASRRQGKREGMEWPSDGFTADGVLTFPPDFDPTSKYPLVLYIHGGPTASSDLGFSAQAQLMAARGWIVFQPNYRGSDNRGNAFQSAIANDAAEGPGRDIMAGIEILRRRPYVDGNRIAVSGWSYGGFMTAWLIGRYPEVWAGAVAGAAPIDLTDMYALADLNRMRRHAITDSPFTGDNLQKYYEMSPIKNLAKIRAPTLILSKTADSRVTITGSYKLFHALRDNGVPVQFIAYPGPGHFPADPVRTRDVFERWIGWLGQYLGEAKP